MRLLLDAHLSSRRIAAPLRKSGHDVLALAEDPSFDGLIDAQVLELAAEQERILVTRNARDFAPLLRTWADTGRRHSGCILIWSLRHDQFGAILSGTRRLLREHPSAKAWVDMTFAL